jgi:hypothetical protein
MFAKIHSKNVAAVLKESALLTRRIPIPTKVPTYEFNGSSEDFRAAANRAAAAEKAVGVELLEALGSHGTEIGVQDVSAVIIERLGEPVLVLRNQKQLTPDAATMWISLISVRKTAAIQEIHDYHHFLQ